MKNTKKVTIATLCSIMLLGSMSAAVQAASSQSINSITLKTAAAKAPTDAEKKKMIEAEKKKIEQIKRNPGEVYVLYVSDKALNGGTEFLYYADPLEFKKYEAYEKWASKLKGPIVQEPEGMPEGYTFTKGEIEHPYDKQFNAKLKAEAKGKVAYSKKMEWTEAGEIKLQYANGKNNIKFEISQDYSEGNTSKEYSYKSVDDYSEEDKKNYGDFLRNRLSWGEKGKVFAVSTNPGNPLTKDELIKLAKTMIKK